jgi:uncharacterized protein
VPPNHRRCLICRREAAKAEFLRIVRVYPLGEITLDQGAGRSAYLCPQVSCLQTALKKNRLGRSLKAPIPESISIALERHLAQLKEAHKEIDP